MARTLYGGAPADYVATAQSVGGYQVPAIAPGMILTAWSALTGGSALTDLQTAVGAASAVVTADVNGRVLFYGPDGFTADIWVQDPNSGVRYRIRGTSGGAGGASLPNTLVVSANGSGIVGAYNCDGTADDVEINAALAALRAGAGGTVLLTAGVYNLAAPILVEGFDDVDVEQDLYLRGAGPKNTTLNVAGGVNCGVRLTKCVRAHVWDLGLTIGGTSDGIQAVATATPAAGHRSAWMSTIHRIQVLGSFAGTDSGWALDLDNMFRATISDIEVNGTTNGMRFSSSHADFNPGDMTVSRCFVDLYTGAAGGAAYSLESNAGQQNQNLFLTCHSIANPATTGMIAWRFIGATAHIRLVNCNVEQFGTAAAIASAAYDIDIDFVHVTLKNGSVLADLDGYGSRVRCGLAYVEPSATVLLIDDDNTYSAKPNVAGPISIYADTGSTVNADVADFAVVRDCTYAGPGTVAAALKVGPGVKMQAPTIALTDAAAIATDASLGSYFAVAAMAGNRTLGVPTNASDGQECTWRLTASGGARTPTLATGTGGFVLASGTPTVTVSAIASGSTAEITAVYHGANQRWRVSRYQIFTAT
ncbi:phosphonate C-P lyase system protein PhnG [Catenuloplanes japonicus]|uniref:hypothetical protein n=1 Tax=Catenuloplanes japonicus TaxID=33876 RepID=UPI000524E407|nr:hypothetical protein [Catenuloplanes japonicus]